MEHIEIKKGINMYFIPDGKFKTFTASVLIYRKLSRGEVTKNSLVSAMLDKGSEKYADMRAIDMKLESLYGTNFYNHTSRRGECQLLRVGVDAVADEFLPKGENNQEKALELLFELLLKSAFSADALSVEKQNLRDAIEAAKNDKRSYAITRLLEEMCKDEPYGTNTLGYVSDIDAIDAPSLMRHYRQMLDESPIDIVFSGNFDMEAARDICQNRMAQLCERDARYPETEIKKEVREVCTVTEKMDVTQGKLCIGFRTNTDPVGDDYYALVVCNMIYGGSANSKLFNNVREKLSLCYYASTGIERYKGIMTLQSGIEFENFQKAYDEIFAQLDDIKKGNVTEHEFDAAIKTIEGSLAGRYDSTAAMEDYYASQIMLGTNMSIEDYIAKIKQVTLDDVVRVADSIQLDTVYFMEGEDAK
ncbi:MAG: pitrilysin family protein [Clostridia bacterium]|nr:pitrilysin family protein [Clostridia bacterium]